jgi:carbonic anhydrase
MIRYLLISLTILTISIYQIYSKTLDYSESDWPSQCKGGSKQSPVDIPSLTSSSIVNSTSYFQYITTSFPLIKDMKVGLISGTSLGVNLTEVGGFLTAMKNGTTYRYDLVNLLVHTPSEHTINGYTYDVEVQLVLSKNVTWLTGQGVTVDPDANNDYLMVSTFYFSNATSSDTLSEAFNPANSFTNNDISIYTSTSNSFYFYEGSLTTPNCDEKANWVINSAVNSMTSGQLSSIKTWVNSYYKTGNARSTKSLNSRTVYFSDMTNSLTIDDMNFSMIVAAMAGMFIIFFFKKRFDIV